MRAPVTNLFARCSVEAMSWRLEEDLRRGNLADRTFDVEGFRP